MPDIHCDLCGKVFMKHQCYMERSSNHYCSKTCYWDSKRHEPKQCVVCGGSIPIYPKHARKKRTCSEACRKKSRPAPLKLMPEYKAWKNMRDRCSNRNSPAFKLYGLKGVSVCARWGCFQSFLEDMGPRPSPSHSLDRIDTAGNYETSNCRWTDRSTQNHNKRPRSNTGHLCITWSKQHGAFLVKTKRMDNLIQRWFSNLDEAVAYRDGLLAAVHPVHPFKPDA